MRGWGQEVEKKNIIKRRIKIIMIRIVTEKEQNFEKVKN